MVFACCPEAFRERQRAVVQPCQRAAVKVVEDLIRILSNTNNGRSSEAHLRADLSWLLHTRNNEEVDEVGNTDQIGGLFELLQYIAVIIFTLFDWGTVVVVAIVIVDS